MRGVDCSLAVAGGGGKERTFRRFCKEGEIWREGTRIDIQENRAQRMEQLCREVGEGRNRNSGGRTHLSKSESSVLIWARGREVRVGARTLRSGRVRVGDSGLTTSSLWLILISAFSVSRSSAI